MLINKYPANSKSVRLVCLFFQHMDEVPEELKKLYKTVWEIPQRTLITMAADRGPFIDHSQSLNVYIAEPNFAKLTSMHFFGWKKVSEGMKLCEPM